jgi:hypothetical protein
MIAKPSSLVHAWNSNVSERESTFHQLSPYIGKVKSAMAAALIGEFTRPGDLVYDPYSGSGTIALEAWIARRNVIANDLSPYAALLTRAKLNPPHSVDSALVTIGSLASTAAKIADAVDLRTVPKWVRQFFDPDTLREAIAWATVLKAERQDFLLACLMGILHHQRPGFLSYPSSHTVPYLRLKRFPKRSFPSLYQYREVRERLEAKVVRAFKRMPVLDRTISRRCVTQNAVTWLPDNRIAAVLTSPPYMRQLDYGRDNRLRLWFLGMPDWKALDDLVSPGEDRFLRGMHDSLCNWKRVLIPGGCCILIVGDSFSRRFQKSLPDALRDIACSDIGSYTCVWQHTEDIPDFRRVRRTCRGNKSETIIVLRSV